MNGKVDVLAVQAKRLAAAILAGMVMEAKYRGESVTAEEILAVANADPQGNTARYLRQSTIDAVKMLNTFKREPELLAIFGEGLHERKF